MSNTGIFANRYGCPVCNLPILNQETNHDPLGCDGPCQRWFHRQCVGLPRLQYVNVIEHNEDWLCGSCSTEAAAVDERIERQPTPQPVVPATQVEDDRYPQYNKAIDADTTSNAATKMEWGEMKGFKKIDEVLNEAYDEIIKWRKNFFKLPFGSSSKAIVEEACNLMTLYNTKPEWEGLAVKALIVFLPLVLQKPSKNSKAKDHKKHLERRLRMWREGLITSLLHEGEEIQKRLNNNKNPPKQNLTKSFTNLILQGKISAACKLNNRNKGGPLDINDQVM